MSWCGRAFTGQLIRMRADFTSHTHTEVKQIIKHKVSDEILLEKPLFNPLYEIIKDHVFVVRLKGCKAFLFMSEE